jgi:hypothetical protein
MKTLASSRDRAEILRRLREVRPDSPRFWGRMSAHQMICHLSDSFRMAMGLKSVSETGSPLRQRTVKWVALYLPMRWPAGGIRTLPEIDQEIGGTPPADFAADLAELEALFEIVTREPRSFERHDVRWSLASLGLPSHGPSPASVPEVTDLTLARHFTARPASAAEMRERLRTLRRELATP